MWILFRMHHVLLDLLLFLHISTVTGKEVVEVWDVPARRCLKYALTKHVFSNFFMKNWSWVGTKGRKDL